MQKVITMNPFDELFDTNGAIDYLNNNNKKIARITLKKNYSHMGRLLGTRSKVYLKAELDAFIAGEKYQPDQGYESAIFDSILTTEDAADYLGITYSYLRILMSQDKLPYRRYGNTAVFRKQDLDTYLENKS